MKKRYNLSLIPTSKSNEVIALAKKFSVIADKYILSNKSLPHVTLCQFQAEENTIDTIWDKACGALQNKSIDLQFNQFSCITFDNYIFCASLLPNNRDILYKMHVDIVNILQLSINKSFDPHMTLINSKNKEYEKEIALISHLYQPIVDTFTLSLGISDDIGQLTEIIYHYGTENIIYNHPHS